MRYIRLQGPIPAKKQSALNRRQNVLANLATVADKKIYISGTNTWKLLKGWLSELSYGNCWYCEAKTERATSDVDHYRPKAGITIYRNPIIHDGYYWLAYDWSNYRFSCQRCNRPEKDDDKVLRGKANEFPLCDESLRNSTPTSSNIERPVLLDPCRRADTKELAHLINGFIEPAKKKGSISHERARYTCETLGLNNFGVPQKKREGFEPIRLLIELVGNQELVVQLLQKKLNPEKTEYPSFYRAAISTYRDYDWIEALL